MTVFKTFFNPLFAPYWESPCGGSPIFFHLFKSNKMIELKANPVTPIIQVHAVMNFWLACHNIDKVKMLVEAFEDESSENYIRLSDLLKYKCEWNVFKFIEHLKERERGVLIGYIMNNYKGISAKRVEEKYFAQ